MFLYKYSNSNRYLMFPLDQEDIDKKAKKIADVIEKKFGV